MENLHKKSVDFYMVKILRIDNNVLSKYKKDSFIML